jgi:hypothetical protein
VTTRTLLCFMIAGAISAPVLASGSTHLTLKNSGLELDAAPATVTEGPSVIDGGSGPPTDYLFDDGFELPLPFAQDQRFSLMWIGGDGNLHRAAIRGDASIRDTDDPNLSVAHVALGHYCIVIPGGVDEGIVGVLQDQGGTHGTIDVSMGLGHPCFQERDAAVSVQTWQLP